MEYCNYHKHDHVSSIFTPDTHIKAESYVKRAKELGHTTYFTTNHGSGGDIFEAKSLCDAYGLKCLFGIEGYIVPDSLEKDNRNYHIIIIPKTNAARRKVNLITTRANVEGYYYKPRIFIDDLLDLDKDDVYLTTACVAGLLHDADSIEQLFFPLADHFKENMFLEVQSHNIERQKEINRKCLALKKKGFRLIAANDSHYIYPKQSKDRDTYLQGKGIKYDEEDNFILDYPDYDTMVQRFKEQGVLSEQEIKEAIDNTLIFADCEEIYLDKEIKMPTIYPNLTPQERNEELKKHINKAFARVCKEENITGEQRKKYIAGIREEMKVIEDTTEVSMADYFLFNERNTDLAVNKYGGILTRTGRGSCGAFYINRLLGMTQLDRFTSPIPLYPERFISTARVLENRSLADIDFNLVEQEPFVKASRELLGEHGCYPMIAYGTMQLSEAFRNICRSKNIPYDEYNEIAKDVEMYENDSEWKDLIEEAKKFVGAIVSASVHPCAHLLLDKDLREELGVIKVGDFLCVMITSSEADEYKYLKNDYLQVSVWGLISETFAMVGQPIMKVNELLKAVENNNAVWNLYAEGLTATLNQCDGEWATGLIKRYKPRNLAELSMFISCLRPFFESSRETFITRQKYSTGSEHLDEVLKSSNSFILFQESLMQYFEWLGVTPAESIGLIKKISKKKIKPEDFDNLKERLRKSWIEQTGSEDKFEETFKTINDCMSYGFAAPHALAVAIDSLYGAYLKATYPLEYFTVCLNNYVGDDDRTKRLTEEAKAFGITISAIKFRRSDSCYVCDKETNTIYKGVSSIKFLNEKVSHAMFEMRNQTFDSFIDFLKVNPCNSKQTEILIKLDFFEEFGGSAKLLRVYELFDELYGAKNMKKEKAEKYDVEIIKRYSTETPKMYKIIDSELMLKEMIKSIPDEPLSPIEVAKFQYDTFGYIDVVNPALPKNLIFVTKFNKTYSPRFIGYCLATGKSCPLKVYKNRNSWVSRESSGKITTYKDLPFDNGDILSAQKFDKKPKLIKTENGFVKDYNQMEWWLTKYTTVKRW